MKQKTTKAVALKDNVEVAQSYKNLLNDLKSIISKGQSQAYKSVDNIRVQTSWQIGERIIREELKYKGRAEYGKYLVDKLVLDLGMERQRIYEIIKFHKVYPIVRTVSGQLSWSHYLNLIEIKNEKERSFYQNQAVLHSWSVRELRRQIKNNLYENTPAIEIEETFKTKLPDIEPQQVFKGVYDFNFIELPASKSEKELEDKILDNVEHFLKELGGDFCIAGRQVPIKIDGQAHFIDLVLFHKGIPCNVLVDLKIGKLDSGDIGQMNQYINYYRHNKQYDYEKDTIGLIICEDAGKEKVFYALGGLEEKIFIAKYKVKLPSEEKIKRAIKGGKN